LSPGAKHVALVRGFDRHAKNDNCCRRHDACDCAGRCQGSGRRWLRSRAACPPRGNSGAGARGILRSGAVKAGRHITPESGSAAALGAIARADYDEGTSQRIREAALSYSDMRCAADGDDPQ